MSVKKTVAKIIHIAYPTAVFRLFSKYGYRGTYYHQGWDVTAKNRTVVRGGLPFKVMWVGYDHVSGIFVTVWYPSLNLFCCFAHLDSTTVNKGQVCKTMAQIGYSGYTGHTIPDNVPAGAHLHMEFGKVMTKYGYITDASKINPALLYWVSQKDMKKLLAS